MRNHQTIRLDLVTPMNKWMQYTVSEVVQIVMRCLALKREAAGNTGPVVHVRYFVLQGRRYQGL